MTSHSNRKQRAREFAAEHGVSYTEALRTMDDQQVPAGQEPGRVPTVGVLAAALEMLDSFERDEAMDRAVRGEDGEVLDPVVAAAMAADAASFPDADPVRVVVQIQPAPVSASVHEPRPYPYFVADDGRVLRQDVWQGDPARLLGFTASAEPDEFVVTVDEFIESPEQVVGMFAVFSTAADNWYTLMRPVESVRVLDSETVTKIAAAAHHGGGGRAG